MTETEYVEDRNQYKKVQFLGRNHAVDKLHDGNELIEHHIYGETYDVIE